jgi:hypothetical protein
MTEVDTTLLLTQMTSRQVEAEIARGRTTVVVPFGALEQHGPAYRSTPTRCSVTGWDPCSPSG